MEKCIAGIAKYGVRAMPLGPYGARNPVCVKMCTFIGSFACHLVFECPGHNNFENRCQKIENQWEKRTQKIRERAGGNSCGEAAFCKGDPAPRASLRKKLLRPTIKN